MLLVCMFSELTIGVTKPASTLFPGEDFLWFSAFLTCLQLVLCVRMDPSATATYFGTSLLLIHLIFRQSCWWDILGVASDITRRPSLTTNSLVLWLLPSFQPLLYSDSWALVCGNALWMQSSGRGSQPQFGCAFLSWSPSVIRRTVLDAGWGLYLSVDKRQMFRLMLMIMLV